MDYAREYAKEQGREEGIKEGREEGEQNKAIEIAKSLIEANMETKFICKTTGLDKKIVDGLRYY
jgi:predicted transposase/invertase (TIGR01784 family)